MQIEKIELPYQALLMRSAVYADVANGLALERATSLEPWLRKFDYAAISLAGRDFAIVVLRIAHSAPIPAEWLEQLDALMDLQGEHCMAYADARRGVSKKALVEDNMLTGLRLTGETAAGGWLKELMIERAPTDTVRRWLFAPLPKAPVASVGRGRIVCNCPERGRERNPHRCGRRQGSRCPAGHAQVRHVLRLLRAGAEKAHRRGQQGHCLSPCLKNRAQRTSSRRHSAQAGGVRFFKGQDQEPTSA